jgi:hypothetical protein
VVHSKEEFKGDMAGFFDVFNELMAQKADWLIGAQTLAVRHFSRFFAHLESLFSIQERSSIAGKFLDSVKGNTTTRLNVEKLLLIHSIISDSLFQNAGTSPQLAGHTSLYPPLRLIITLYLLDQARASSSCRSCSRT